MNDQLEAIKEALETGNHDEARVLAKQYIIENASDYVDEQSMPVEACVNAVDVYRAAAMDTRLWEMEAWILYRFAPQNIGGVYRAPIANPLPTLEGLTNG